MDCILKNLNIYHNGAFVRGDISVRDGRVASIDQASASGSRVLDFSDKYAFPGFADVHVHLREPGFSYKETIRTGTMAAARGGYTDVCAMPNLSPVPDCPARLQPELTAIERGAVIRVHPYGAISRGEKGIERSDMTAMAGSVIAYSDDGKGVQSPELMKKAMLRAKALDKLIAAHCEDESLIAHGWCVNDGVFARENGLIGNDPASEWRQVERDLRLAAETGCAYHVCHVSTKESVALIRSAKARGVDVTCETAPHYLLLDDSMLRDDGGYRMNPPIRARADRAALIAGLLDGTIDMIATDHAPHSAEEKSGGLLDSLNGIVGLETAFPVLYTGLVLPGILSLPKLIELMSVSPKRRFGVGGSLEVGGAADLCVFDLDTEYHIDPNEFLSLGRSTPFDGMAVRGKCLMTMLAGEPVYTENGGNL